MGSATQQIYLRGSPHFKIFTLFLGCCFFGGKGKGADFWNSSTKHQMDWSIGQRSSMIIRSLQMIFVKQPEELPRKTNQPPAFWPRPRASWRSFCSCWEFKSRTDGYLGNISSMQRRTWLFNWLVVWNMAFMTFHILGIIIPIDFHIFQRGWNHQPVERLLEDPSEIDEVKWWSKSEFFNHKDQISLIYHDFVAEKWLNKYNVNPGLINHGLLIRGYSPNSHNLILKWYPPIKQPRGLLIQGWH